MPKVLIEREPADSFVNAVSVASESQGVISHDEIATELQTRLEHGVHTVVQVIRQEFQQRMRTVSAQWENERQSLLDEIEDLRRKNSGHEELSLEVTQTETTLEVLREEIQLMLDDPTVELSYVMQKKAQQAELGAYLKGLKFKGYFLGCFGG